MGIRSRKPWSEAPAWATVLLSNENGSYVFASAYEEDAKAWPPLLSASYFRLRKDAWGVVGYRPTTTDEYNRVFGY